MLLNLDLLNMTKKKTDSQFALSRVDSISLHLKRYQIDIKTRKQDEPELSFFEVPTDATAVDYLVQLSLILYSIIKP